MCFRGFAMWKFHSSAFNQKVINRLLSLLLISATFNVLAGCSTPTGTTQNAAPEASPATDTEKKELKTVKFTLSWLFQGVDAPLTTAIEKGYFANEGIDVKFERGYGSADSINKVAAGQYDIAEGDMYSMVEFNQKNPDNKLIAVAIKYNKSPFAIVSPKKNGIDSPDKLAGKELGAPAGDAARRLFPVFAKTTGIKADSVTWTNVEPKIREALLAKGDLDAISCFTISSLPPLEKLGFSPDQLNVFYYTNFGLDLYGNALIVKESFAKENPDLIKGFVKAYLKGLQETVKEPDTAFATVAKFGKGGTFDEKLERERLQIALDSLYVSDESKEIGVGAVDPDRLKKTLEQVSQGFGLAKVPIPEDVFDDSFLPPKEDRAI